MSPRVYAVIAFAFFSVLLPLGAVQGHEVRPALLNVRERVDGCYDVSWKRPTMGDVAVHLVPHISGGIIERAPDLTDSTNSFQLSVWKHVCPGFRGLEGRELAIEGLDQTLTDALVSVQLRNSNPVESILSPSRPSMTLHAYPPGVGVPAYLLLGIEHILTGYDHLSFVLGLVLLAGSRLKKILGTVTAFTVAHSITLALTVLKVITIRPALIETFVALSIIFVAVELVHVYQGRRPPIARHPWIIALAFGLLHGCAFAGALAQVGLPENAILPSLLLFNIGVEIGQLLFVGVVLIIASIITQLPRPLPAWSQWVPPYAIGSIAAFWFIDRIQTALL